MSESSDQNPDTPSSDLPIEASVQEVQQLLQGDAEKLVLIDCREPNEYEFCRIDSAELIPMNQTPERLSQLQAHSDDRLVVYCHSGVRSFHVARYLRSQGISRAQSMAGGIDRWSQEIDPSVPTY